MKSWNLTLFLKIILVTFVHCCNSYEHTIDTRHKFFWNDWSSMSCSTLNFNKTLSCNTIKSSYFKVNGCSIYLVMSEILNYSILTYKTQSIYCCHISSSCVNLITFSIMRISFLYPIFQKRTPLKRVLYKQLVSLSK